MQFHDLHSHAHMNVAYDGDQWHSRKDHCAFAGATFTVPSPVRKYSRNAYLHQTLCPMVRDAYSHDELIS